MPELGEESLEFSPLGGPLHRLGIRLRLVRERTNTVRMGLALGLFLWIVLASLALIEGIGPQIFSLAVIGGHARLLLVIPLFFVCESWVIPRMTAFVGQLTRTGIVSGKALPELESLVRRTNRWADAWLPEALCAAAAVILSLIAPKLNLIGATTSFDAGRTTGALTATAVWYWAVCLTVFRFLMFRWIWRLLLWWSFLWRLEKLDLQLAPIHPDCTAGLGNLEGVHTHFIPLVLAISVTQAASLAEDVSAGRAVFESVYPVLTLTLIVVAVLFLSPLFIFSPKLWACRTKGMGEYMGLARRYVDDFDKKWLGANAPDTPLLGTADLQSLADLSNSVDIVRNMRRVPLGPKLLSDLTVAALLPMLPLVLFKYPAAELAEKFIRKLSGL